MLSDWLSNDGASADLAAGIPVLLERPYRNDKQKQQRQKLEAMGPNSKVDWYQKQARGVEFF